MPYIIQNKARGAFEPINNIILEPKGPKIKKNPLNEKKEDHQLSV
jgi:hypothetical protein